MRGPSIDLLVVSTNEVFDGARTDGQGYRPDDDPRPGNPYGASKLEGERLAAAAYANASGGRLGIVRTAWLFGTPGRDFPSRILDAAEAAAATGEPLRAVADEWGTPTYIHDLADAIVELLAADAVPGIHHVINGGVASRADWARDTVAPARRCRRHRRGPIDDLAADLDAAAMGRPRADAAPIR